MRYSADQKDQTRQRILDAAGRLFRRKGYRGAGIDAVMAEAGLTAGAFYKHFDSKEQLLEEVLQEAFRRHPHPREQGLDDLDGRDWLEGLIQNYLSHQHYAAVEEGCPMPPLVPEISRSSSAVRDAFERGLMEWRDEMMERLDGVPTSERELLALGLIATLVGGMALARGMPDEEKAHAMLHGAAQSALDTLRSHWPSQPSIDA